MASSPIFRNLGTKALALGIAILLWFVFSAQQRERISERSYRIPLSVANVPASTLIASPLPPSVEVRLRGPFTALRQLDPDRLEAVIDLTSAARGEKIYRIAPEDVNVPREIEVIAIAPSEVRVELDSSAERSVPISPRLTGRPGAGATVVEITVEPKVARLVGPASTLARMTAIDTDPISLADRTASFTVPASVIVDAPGVRVREGQIVTVHVRLNTPRPTPVPPPTPARRKTK
ncbi:MAG TPA: CdaR family protein [Thermoanaerobaculia bacterium]|nr:CdaR family protein [Thermoanaerobaculia bacterium]